MAEARVAERPLCHRRRYEEGMLKLRMAYAIIYTLPGVPCLYYGDEIGMQATVTPSTAASTAGTATKSG